MTDPNESQPVGRWREPPQSRSGTLVFACLVIGLLGGLVQSQRVRIHNEQQRATSMATSAELYAGESQELGQLMADPRTLLVHLTAADASSMRGASLVWNGSRQRGALFCEQLPIQNAGQSYEIWAVDDSGGVASQLADVNAEAGVSVYPFHSTAAPLRPNRFEVIDGQRTADVKPMLAGTVTDNGK